MKDVNGLFYQYLRISVSSDSHDDCLFVYKHFKKMSEAWYGDLKIFESKSARSGPVLKRTIDIQLNGYAHEIIAFKEAIRCIHNHFNIFSKSQINLEDLGAHRKNAFDGFPN